MRLLLERHADLRIASKVWDSHVDDLYSDNQHDRQDRDGGYDAVSRPDGGDRNQPATRLLATHGIVEDFLQLADAKVFYIDDLIRLVESGMSGQQIAETVVSLFPR